MANAFLKPEVIAAAGLGILRREVVLPQTVSRLGIADFRGAKNDTITMRVPAIRTAKTRAMRSGAALVAEDLTEVGVDVTLDTHVYDLANITDEELTLDIRDFGAQVLQPQIRGVVEELEDTIVGALEGATVGADQELSVDESDDPYDVFVDARKVLNTLNVPRASRFAVLGANVEAWALKSDKLSKVNESGGDSALRDATLGRVAGFTTLGSNAVDPDAAYFYVSSAVAFALVAPAVPAGATFGQSVSSDGMALRWLRDYDPTYARDRSLVDAFTGASSVEDTYNDDPAFNRRLVKLELASAGS